MQTQINPNEYHLQLPPIALVELPEGVKDFIISRANKDHCTPTDAIKKVLLLSASRAGFGRTTTLKVAGGAA